MSQNNQRRIVSAKAIHDLRYAAMIRAFRNRRVQLGMTQHEAASKIGMSRHWLSKVERREVRLDIFHFVRFCQVCGVRPERMLRYLTGEKPPPRRGFFFNHHTLWIPGMEIRAGRFAVPPCWQPIETGFYPVQITSGRAYKLREA